MNTASAVAAAPQLPLTEARRATRHAVVPSLARIRVTLRKSATIRSPLGAKTTPSYAPAVVRSWLRQRTAPVVASRAYSTCDTLAPLPERDAYTAPSRHPAIHAIQSWEVLPLKGSVTRHRSAPVPRSQQTTASFAAPPLVGNPVSRMANTRSPSVTGAHAMIAPLFTVQRRSAEVTGPSAPLSPFLAALPPELDQSCARVIGQSGARAQTSGSNRWSRGMAGSLVRRAGIVPARASPPGL